MNAAEAFAKVEEYESAVNTCGTPLPAYISHKRVWALKIKEIHFDHERRGPNEETDGTAIIVPEEQRYAPIRLSAAYVRKHDPKAGGYWVQYDGGYQSWSPAEAFEAGYTAVKPGDNPHGVYHGIGWAVKMMQDGLRVCRAGWNGKGMWIGLIPGDQWGLGSGQNAYDYGAAGPGMLLPWIGMRTAQGTFVPWLCSQTDLLATDWEIAE